MKIIQFEDKNLAHFSYAVIESNEMVLIDPARDPKPYMDLAQTENIQKLSVIETHPHADFISSHLELHERFGAALYVSKLVKAQYPHTGFDDGDVLRVGKVSLHALNTPGHSPDSISVLLKDAEGKQKAVFSGDTLFIGDCGRPDLRENAGAIKAQKQQLAKQMYQSLRQRFMAMDDDVVVYPAHGAGSLCGKGLSSANESTIGQEKKDNWSLQPSTEEAFIERLLAEQPFIPKYFGHAVEINRKGAPHFKAATDGVNVIEPIQCAQCAADLDSNTIVIDTRSNAAYDEGHLDHSINLMTDLKFETWLGSIVLPGEPFYLAAADESTLGSLIGRIAKIGYEDQIKSAFVLKHGVHKNEAAPVTLFASDTEAYTIVDIRNESEVASKSIFNNALNIPLHELRERASEVPLNKDIIVHCAGGYRSAAGSSILREAIGNKTKVYDLSVAIKSFSEN